MGRRLMRCATAQIGIVSGACTGDLDGGLGKHYSLCFCSSWSVDILEPYSFYEIERLVCAASGFVRMAAPLSLLASAEALSNNNIFNAFTPARLYSICENDNIPGITSGVVRAPPPAVAHPQTVS